MDFFVEPVPERSSSESGLAVACDRGDGSGRTPADGTQPTSPGLRERSFLGAGFLRERRADGWVRMNVELSPSAASICMYIYIYIQKHTHTHTHTHTRIHSLTHSHPHKRLSHVNRT